jgi:P4 family phage/plasmid primase-like protien
MDIKKKLRNLKAGRAKQRRTAPRKTTQQKTSSLTATDRQMFARFKVSAAMVEGAGIYRVDDAQARALHIRGRNLAGIVFPYLDPNTDDIVTVRVRRDHPEMEDGKPVCKYLCPTGDKRTLYVLPQSAVRLKDTRIPIVLVEAEKSSLALTAWAARTKHDLIVIAMGGCWGWSQDKKAIPALLEFCKDHPVIVLLDANAATNANVKDAQAALTTELHKPDYCCPDVSVAALPQIEGVNGPDDLLAQPEGDALLAGVLDAATPAEDTDTFSEHALAAKFSEQYGNDLRYVAEWGQWLRWDGQRWEKDKARRAFDKARKVCCAATEYCSKKQIVQRVRSAQTRAAVVSMASQDERHIATVDQWDADPWLLNTPGGVVDLQTGKMRPADRGDYMTKITTTSPSGDCPLWRRFLSEITDNDKALQSYLQRMMGYALTGSTEEHALFFLYGTGANGKSVFLETLFGIMGDYARVVPMEALIVLRNEQHSTDVAGLVGARLAAANEVEEGTRWNESKIKALTGGDMVTARFMRQDFFDFKPRFKLIVRGNYKPSVRSVDEGMKRRMNLVPFDVTIPKEKRDHKLPEKLRAEWSGILQWMIEGCLEWQRIGLRPPKIVTAATEDYLSAEDTLGRWLDERCVLGKNKQQGSTELFVDWKRWADTRGEFTGRQQRFSQNLEARGFTLVKSHGRMCFLGLELRSIDAVTATGNNNSAATARKYAVQ